MTCTNGGLLSGSDAMRILRALVIVLIATSSSAIGTPAAEASHSCVAVAQIWRLSNTTYNIGGYGSCNVTVSSLTLSCKPVHKHSVGWHSHSGTTFPPSSNTTRTPSSGSWAWGPVGGTDGDTYKTSCTGTFISHGSTITHTDESFTITL